MEENFNTMEHKMKQIAGRIKELRLISGLSVEEMAAEEAPAQEAAAE